MDKERDAWINFTMNGTQRWAHRKLVCEVFYVFEKACIFETTNECQKIRWFVQKVVKSVLKVF